MIGFRHVMTGQESIPRFPGYVGYCDGVGYITVSSRVSLPELYVDNFRLSMYVKPLSITSHSAFAVINSSNTTSVQTGGVLVRRSATSSNLDIKIGNNPYTSTLLLNELQWNHIVVEKIGSVAKLFINGIEEVITESLSALAITSSTSFGATIDNISGLPTFTTNAEISDILYDELNLSGDVINNLLNIKVNEGIGSITADSSPNALDGDWTDETDPTQWVYYGVAPY